jgi:predicted DNA-binding transcriptional regulator YafY
VTAERYVTATELAQLMAVSVKTVRRLTAAGMPSESWGMARTRRYLPSEAIAWARNPNIGFDRPTRRFTIATGKD